MSVVLVGVGSIWKLISTLLKCQKKLGEFCTVLVVGLMMYQSETLFFKYIVTHNLSVTSILTAAKQVSIKLFSDLNTECGRYQCPYGLLLCVIFPITSLCVF